MEKRLIRSQDIEPDAICTSSLATSIGSNKGLPADTAGTVLTSAPFVFRSKGAKSLILATSISSIPTDATIEIAIYNNTQASLITSKSYAGTTGSSVDTFDISTLAKPPNDGDLIVLQVNVTTASATAGSTFDLDYAVLQIDYCYA